MRSPPFPLALCQFSQHELCVLDFMLMHRLLSLSRGLLANVIYVYVILGQKKGDHLLVALVLFPAMMCYQQFQNRRDIKILGGLNL